MCINYFREWQKIFQNLQNNKKLENTDKIILSFPGFDEKTEEKEKFLNHQKGISEILNCVVKLVEVLTKSTVPVIGQLSVIDPIFDTIHSQITNTIESTNKAIAQIYSERVVFDNVQAIIQRLVNDDDDE